MSKAFSRAQKARDIEAEIQQKKKYLAALKKTLAQSELALDQVRKALNDVELRLELMKTKPFCGFKQ